MEYKMEGDCIECQHSEIFARKFSYDPPRTYSKIGSRIVKYTCDRDSSAEITKELNPKVPKVDGNSKLNLGDKLLGKKIYCYIDNPRRLKPSKEPHTGNHKSQKIKPKDFTFARISMPFPDIKALEDKKSLKK